MIFLERMRLVAILFIVIALLTFFLEKGTISYAQDPISLQKNLDQEGIKSPLPQNSPTAISPNYYPDQRLPLHITDGLLIVGLLLMFAGAELLTSDALHLVKHKTKPDSYILSKHMGHSI
jgi:hypothetical protein